MTLACGWKKLNLQSDLSEELFLWQQWERNYIRDNSIVFYSGFGTGEPKLLPKKFDHFQITNWSSLAVSSEPKYFDTNSESYEVLPAICTVILASFMLLHTVTAPTQDIFDCYVWNGSSRFLGTKTFWYQFQEFLLVTYIRYHHPGKLEGVQRAGTLYFNARKSEAPRTELFNLCYQNCSNNRKNAPHSRY